MAFHWTQVFSIALTLFLLMDPIGNVPIFVSVLKNIPARRHWRIILRELCIALGVILLFQFIGDALLQFLHVSTPTLLIAGGLILFLIALKMIFPSPYDAAMDRVENKEPFIVPLAIPLVAGPAVLAAVMLYAGQEEHFHPGAISLAILLAWIASTFILISAPLWKRMLGSKGLIACERLMGLILILLSVQMFLEGMAQFLLQLR